MKRQTHKGKPRSIIQRKKHTKPPVFEDGIPFFSFQNYPLIRKQLLRLVRSCPHRQNTGKITTAPCCRVEQGQVFYCLLYHHQPARLYDCLNCKKREAIQQGESWIKPLVELSRGLVPQQSLQEVQSVISSSDAPPTFVPRKLPGRSGDK